MITPRSLKVFRAFLSYVITGFCCDCVEMKMQATFHFKTSLIVAGAIALGASSLVLSACNGPAGASFNAPTGGSPLTTRARATPTDIPYTFQTVNDPNSNTNEVTGINQRGKIVGTYGGGSGSSIPESYTGEPPYGKFRGINYPGAEGTSATSLTSNRIEAGYVTNPNQLNGIWAFVRANGVWALLKDRKQGSGQYAVTEILGINDSEFAVGFYDDNTGKEVPFELNVVTENFTNLQPPGAISAEATGINGKGNICGFEELNDHSYAGYYLQTGSYYQLKYPGALNTWAWGLNWQDQIVGQYEDSKHNLHGFMLTYPTAGSGGRYWQTIDVKGAVSTKLTGINNHHLITGSFYDSYGNKNGFIGNPKT